MREIINIQLGQCGNHIGYSFLQKIAEEHGINSECIYTGTSDSQRERINVYFNQIQDNIYNSRSILIDLEPGTIDSILGQKLGKLYNCDNFKVGLGSAGNNWATGYLTQGSYMIEDILDSIRKEADACDNVQGFQFMHATGGGTGSGLSSLLMQKIKDQFPDKITQTFSIFPTQSTTDVIVQSYNTMLTMSRLVQQAELTHIIQNQALLNVCTKRLKLQRPTYKDMNRLIGMAASGITCGIRFPGKQNLNLRKMAVNLVVFPRSHFLSDSISPLIAKSNQFFAVTEKEHIQELFQYSSFLNTADPRQGRYFTASLNLRGKVSTFQTESVAINTQNKNSSYFVEWIPNNIQISYCDISLPGYETSGVLVSNSTSIQKVFKNISESVTPMLRRKAFLHWYTGKGMDEMQFTQAESNLNDLASQYQLHWGSCCEEEEPIEQ